MPTPMTAWGAVTRGAAVNVGGAVAMVGVRALGVVLRAVFGGPAYGLFVIAYNLVELATYLLLGGFVDSMVMFTARYLPGAGRASELSDPEREDRLYRSLAASVGVPVIIGLAVAIAVQWAAPWLHRAIWRDHDPLLVELVQRLSWALPLLVLMQLPVEALKAKLRWGWSVSIVQVGFPALSVLGALASELLFDRGIGALVDGVLIAFAVCVPLSMFAFGQHFSLAKLLRALGSGRWDTDVLGFALPQGLNMALNQGLVRVDTLVLSAYVSADAVGVYALVSELTQIVRLGKMSISGVYSPFAARLIVAGDRAALADALHRMATMTAWLSIPLLLAVMALYPSLVMDRGETWQGSALYPWLLCVGPLMSCFFGLAGNTLLMSGRPRLLLANSIVAGTLNVVLNLVLVPRAGLLGAAVATSIANFAISCLGIAELARFERLTFRWGLYARTVASAALPVAGVAALGAPSGALLSSWGVEAALPARIAVAVAAVVLFYAAYAVMRGPSAFAVWRGTARPA